MGLSEYNNYVDPLYRERHDFVKKWLIDAMICEFSNTITVSSEQIIENGTIDICLNYDKIINNNREKRKIGFEIKGGKSADVFQIRRYLGHLDTLFFVRVPTQEVTRISQRDVIQVLIRDNFLKIDKIRQIKEQQLIKVPGERCKGCTAPCQYKRPGYDRQPIASLQDLPEFLKNVNVVTEKVIRELKFDFDRR